MATENQSENNIYRNEEPNGSTRFVSSRIKPKTQKEITEWRKRELVFATLLCVAEKGIHQTTVEEITSRANVSRGLIRHHFKNKQDLMVRACKYLCDDFRMHIEKNVKTNDDPWKALDHLVTTTFETPYFNDVSLAAWFSFWIASRNDDDLKLVYKEYYEWYRGYIHKLFERADKLGQLHTDLDQTIDAFVSMTDGLWLELSIDVTKYSPEYAASVCREFFKAFSQRMPK